MGFLSLRQETVLYVFVLDPGVQEEDIVDKMLGGEEEGGGGVGKSPRNVAIPALALN